MYFKMSHVTLPLWKLRGVAEDATVVLVALLGRRVLILNLPIEG